MYSLTLQRKKMVIQIIGTNRKTIEKKQIQRKKTEYR